MDSILNGSLSRGTFGYQACTGIKAWQGEDESHRQKGWGQRIPRCHPHYCTSPICQPAPDEQRHSQRNHWKKKSQVCRHRQPCCCADLPKHLLRRLSQLKFREVVKSPQEKCNRHAVTTRSREIIKNKRV